MHFLLHSRARMHLKKEQVPKRRTQFPHSVPRFTGCARILTGADLESIAL